MDTLVVQDVRCFHTRVEAPIAPVTFLIGENSTGKSSFLALVRAAWDVAVGRHPSFNVDPFQLGSFDSIAHFHGGRGKRATRFVIGARTRIRPATKTGPGDPMLVAFEGEFKSLDGQTRMTTWSVSLGETEISLEYSANDEAIISVHGETRKIKFPWLDRAAQPIGHVFDYALRSAFAKASRTMRSSFRLPDDYESLSRLLFMAQRRFSRQPYAIAPIRTRPARTYDPIHDQASPEGEHVPVVLSQISTGRKTDWDPLRAALQRFGQNSGLFSRLDIRHLGRHKAADPFQLEVGLQGQRGRRNIIDVGYGVSQVLPILVESLVQPSGTMFLVQQPEVHLHPRAQAELGTFIAEMARQQRHRFLIETHSDHLVDRVSMEVRDGRLSMSDVSLLFFEPTGSEVRVVPLTMDSRGNIINAPSSYRQFFLNEQLRFIGGDETNVRDS